jgi:hypothetical protein
MKKYLIIFLLIATTSSSFGYYNPSQGRWLSRDPIEERGGVNLYGVVGNNLINGVDLYGLGTWSFEVHDNGTVYMHVEVTYDMDAKERKCCQEAVIDRFVRELFGVFACRWGRWGSDNTPGGGGSYHGDDGKAYAEEDKPIGVGVGLPFGRFFGGKYGNIELCRFSRSYAFKWIARCVKGPWTGKELSTAKKTYKVEGGWGDGGDSGAFTD